MNFDFLKGLCGLGYVFENCSNAEKLAMTMPVQSVFTSRKSAELLAKFIYLAAHNQKMEELTFSDILSDYTVRKFIHSKDVMDAFHYIRKSGNRAVHGDSQEESMDAIAVLEELHYVAGETACILGLIKKYPTFDSRIELYPNAKFVDERDVEAKAQKMFLEYIEKYNAQVERDNYYQIHIDNLINEFDSIYKRYQMVPGEVDINEVLEFKKMPVHTSSLKPIQAYYGFLGIRKIKKIKGELIQGLEGRDIEFNGELTLYGENGYTTSDLGEFVYAILKDLPSADGFKIVSEYSGPSVAPWFEANEKERKEEFSTEIAEIGKTEKFTYMLYEFLYNHGEGQLRKFENGEWNNLEDQYTTDILDKDFGIDWWCWNLDLSVEFDFDKYPDIVNSLHECVRNSIPKDQVKYCEDTWEDGDVGILCNSISWYPRKLRIIQNFLDAINGVLKPIINECEGSGFDSKWFIKEAPFAIATWAWSNNGFIIKGTQI